MQALDDFLDVGKLLVVPERLWIQQRAAGRDFPARDDLLDGEFNFFEVDGGLRMILLAFGRAAYSVLYAHWSDDERERERER